MSKELVNKFIEKPYTIDMGAKKLAKWFKAPVEEIKKARIKAKEQLKASAPNILVLDIETAPMKVQVFGLWKQNIRLPQIDSFFYMLTWSAKWLGDKKVHSDRLTGKEALAESDKRICQSLWAMLDKADIVIAHNGNKFDLPKIKTRFLMNKLPVFTPYRTIDTLLIARKQFAFDGNSLNTLAKHFDLGGKLDTSFELWDKCTKGEDESLKYMEEYNREDVLLLEDVYMVLRPWIANHPNVTLNMNLKKPACTTCGSSSIYPDGEYSTQVNVYETYRCKTCRSIAGRVRKSSVSVNDKKHMLMPIAKL